MEARHSLLVTNMDDTAIGGFWEIKLNDLSADSPVFGLVLMRLGWMRHSDSCTGTAPISHHCISRLPIRYVGVPPFTLRNRHAVYCICFGFKAPSDTLMHLLSGWEKGWVCFPLFVPVVNPRPAAGCGVWWDFGAVCFLLPSCAKVALRKQKERVGVVRWGNGGHTGDGSRLRVARIGVREIHVPWTLPMCQIGTCRFGKLCTVGQDYVHSFSPALLLLLCLAHSLSCSLPPFATNPPSFLLSLPFSSWS